MTTNRAQQAPAVRVHSRIHIYIYAIAAFSSSVLFAFPVEKMHCLLRIKSGQFNATRTRNMQCCLFTLVFAIFFPVSNLQTVKQNLTTGGGGGRGTHRTSDNFLLQICTFDQNGNGTFDETQQIPTGQFIFKTTASDSEDRCLDVFSQMQLVLPLETGRSNVVMWWFQKFQAGCIERLHGSTKY